MIQRTVCKFNGV